MTDLVKRLQDNERRYNWNDRQEAAAEIERLQAEKVAMREALQGAFKLPRPWMDGGVTEAEWIAAIDRIEAALASPSGWPESVVALVHYVLVEGAPMEGSHASSVLRKVLDALPASLREAARHD